MTRNLLTVLVGLPPRLQSCMLVRGLPAPLVQLKNIENHLVRFVIGCEISVLIHHLEKHEFIVDVHSL